VADSGAVVPAVQGARQLSGPTSTAVHGPGDGARHAVTLSRIL